ncbi:MAG: hypothetical protein IGS48_21115 [Oscillatoriales cyanobacterium C42_A2020_001]|nr:hypothetical protein [Leptolyngbyaceae cyanobacterium C42_A2020_001]
MRSAGSALSIAIALSSYPAHANDPVPTSKEFSPSSSKIKPSSNQEPIYAKHVLSQASLLVDPVTELSIKSGHSIDSRPIESLKPPFRLNSVAQADAPPPQPSQAQPAEAQPSVPASDAPSAPPASSDASQKTASDRWQFSVAPYFFVPLNAEVDATVLGRSTSIDLSLGDILEFDRAFDAGLRVEAWKNRFGLILDGFYVSLKDSGNLGVTFPAGSLQRFGIPFPVRASADASLSTRQGQIDLAASYRVVDTLLSNPAELTNPYPRLTVAPILGLRINILSQELEVDDIRLNNIPVSGLPLPITLPVNQDFSSSRTTVEPLLGAQIGLDLSRQWTIGIRGDVSGFNVGADRNWTWNLLASIQYNLSSSTSLQLGYRVNDFEFADGSGLRRSRVNLNQNGLLLGVIFRF